MNLKAASDIIIGDYILIAGLFREVTSIDISENYRIFGFNNYRDYEVHSNYPVEFQPANYKSEAMTLIAKAMEMIREANNTGTLDHYDRSHIVSSILHSLDVPGIVWSPQDYVGIVEDRMSTQLDRDVIEEVSLNAYEAHAQSADLVDTDWDHVAFYVDQELEEYNN